MPTLPRKIIVNKVPLERPDPDLPPVSTRQPIMYLEFFENKDKIRQELVNKDYVPRGFQGQPQPLQQPQVEPYKQEEVVVNEVVDTPEIKDISITRSSLGDKSVASTASERSESESESERSESESGRSESESESERSKNEDEDEIAKRLTQLLAKNNSESSDDEEVKQSSVESYNKYSRYREKSISSKSSHISPYQPVHKTSISDVVKSKDRMPPTLAELKEKGTVAYRPELRNVYAEDIEEQEKKRELLYKFNLLRDSYPHARDTIPEFTIHSDYTEMKRVYDTQVRRLTIEDSTNTYKTYLVYGFMITEFVLGRFLNLDMKGFTQHQLVNNMRSYNKLLVELGEKSYVPTESKWPVEFRLLGLIVLNAGLFIIGKMITRNTGMDFISMVNSTAPTPPTQPNFSQSRTRMKGPDINLDDLPNVDDIPEGKSV